MRLEVGEEVGLGVHPVAVGLEAGAAELVEDHAGVVLPVFEQEDAERSSHQHLHLFDYAGRSPLSGHSASVVYSASNRSVPRRKRTYRSMRMNTRPS